LNRDHPDDPNLPYWQHFALGDVTLASEHRRVVLESLLPKLVIRDRCRLQISPLPFEGDRIPGLILSKALMLVNDAKIKDPTIARQLS
jgi:hypothetical protein